MPEPLPRIESDKLAQRTALACVMGDMDLLQPVAMGGIPAAVVTRLGVPSLYSRFATSRLHWDDFSQNNDELLEALSRLAATQSEPPVLFYQEDAQLLFVSRRREELSRAFRFVVAGAPLVEDLVDKARFQALAARCELPVPPARRFHPADLEAGALGVDFPLIIKPLTRVERWESLFGLRKALSADSAEALRALWPSLRAFDAELLAQKLIAGAETRIESYHCYVDRHGAMAGEFTGRKIRTYPASFGHTTALEITDAPDVQRLGCDIVSRIGLTGVAKLDFKRDSDGKLHLLEINPRFTLWHHAGAVAGVNIPAIVYADLTGLPRPPAACAKAGVRWVRAWKDFPAARDTGMPLPEWLRWAAGCEAKSALAWNDPMPVVRSTLHRLLERLGLNDTTALRRGGRQWIGA